MEQVTLYALHTEPFDANLLGIVLEGYDTNGYHREGYWGPLVYDNPGCTLTKWVVPTWVAFVLSDVGYGFSFDVLGIAIPEEIPHNGILSDGYDAAQFLSEHGECVVEDNLGWWD